MSAESPGVRVLLSMCRCARKDTLFDMTLHPVHAWPQLKRDADSICIPSVSLSVQSKVLSTQRGRRPCEQHVCKASLEQKY